MQLRCSLQERYRHPGFAVPTPTLNFGCIHGGDNPNRICGQCELSFDFRLLPGMDGYEIRELIRKQADESAQPYELKVEFETIMDVVPGMETPADASVVRHSERISGKPAQAVSFTTEGPFYRAENMDVVVMGPGDIACAHQPNEYLPIERLALTTDQLGSLIRTFCLTEDWTPKPENHNAAT